jgi:serine/threonine protein kinase
LEAPFALKVLTITAPGVRERLVAEGKVQSQLNHPNVLRVLDVLDVHGTPGLLMDYVDGPELGDWIDETQPSLDEALRVFAGIAAGVRAAHEAGLVHRDLKPGNILMATGVDGEAIPKVSDFGLVKAVAGETLRKGATRAGMPMGTPAYMPPEQIRDASSVDGRADVFALGCILYELVAHERAFQGADTLSLYQAAREEAYLPLQTVRPEVPDYVGDVVTQLLRADPEARFESVAEVLETLYLDDVPDVTEDVVPEVFQVWSEARVSTATAAAVREMAPAQTVPAVPRAVEPETPAATLPRGAVVGLGIGGLLGLCLGLLLAWWVLA